MLRNINGLRLMNRLPEAIVVVDPKKEHNVVHEAHLVGIKVIALLDTDCNPDDVDLPIPGNDDAIRANDLLTRVIAEAVIEGRFIAQKRNPGGNAAEVAPVERTAEENAVFEAQQADARRQAAEAQASREARLAATKSTEPAAE